MCNRKWVMQASFSRADFGAGVFGEYAWSPIKNKEGRIEYWCNGRLLDATIEISAGAEQEALNKAAEIADETKRITGDLNYQIFEIGGE